MSPWIMLTTFCFTSVVQAGIILLLAAQEGGYVALGKSVQMMLLHRCMIVNSEVD
ncbi:hypothetical protein RDI58_021504 [Solanum bulbocastanum]|uniref:Uncharacterized protein n=1 Tax=Solanum bulbocastanum TaxID=147425 RepID=A0AAN8Y4G1_SOLBU